MDFNRISMALLLLAASDSPTKGTLPWREACDAMDGKLPYWGDMNQAFVEDVTGVLKAMTLYEQAMSEGDRLTARAGLHKAEFSAFNLMSFFDALLAELNRASLDPKHNWPDFPKNYKIPARYGFSE